MYANTTYNHMYYEAMYTQYHPVHQTKMFVNVHYVSICQTYGLPKYITCTLYKGTAIESEG